MLIPNLIEEIKRCEIIKQEFKRDNNKVFDFIQIENQIERAKASLSCYDIVEQLECFEDLRKW